ncbi:phage tail family protein [Streptomyces sp. NBC_01197]|uniref:phage tail family protein n=1 Tax=Streptomyces sp. NBC_01197 TaxID=2903768 RepID=UPI002E10EDD2|nr:phage tail family protein [Streptomyces sp. NBC_01197]
MAIPALRAAPPAPLAKIPSPPTPVHWERTYVSITGRDGQGEEIPLTSFSNSLWPGIFVQPGATGLDAPPFELHSDDSPNLDGGMFRSARAVAREIMIPLVIYGVDRQTMKGIQKKLTSALNPKKGYCVIKFVEGNAVPRHLYCYYKGGMEGSEDASTAGFHWKKYGLTFTAFDPYFYSDSLEAAQWSFGTGSPFLPTTGAFLPLNLNAGLVSSSAVEVDNPGDVEAWPVWKLKGPIRSFTFTSPDGDSFGISAPTDGSNIIAGGRTLTIDTRPGYKSLKDDLGTNYWPLLDPNPVLWSIPDGVSDCTVSILPGSSTAVVQLTYSPRYEGY